MGQKLRVAQRKMGDGPDREWTDQLPDANKCLVVAGEPGWRCSNRVKKTRDLDCRVIDAAQQLLLLLLLWPSPMTLRWCPPIRPFQMLAGPCRQQAQAHRARRERDSGASRRMAPALSEIGGGVSSAAARG